MEGFSHHADFPDELSRPYSPHDEAEALDFSHPDADADETQLTQDCGYNSSASSTHPSSGDLHDADYEDDELHSLKSRASSRSSVSSLPGSVFTHSMEASKTIARDAPESAIFWDDRYSGKGQGRAEPGLKSLQALRQRESAFRKPSSVRALQMHTEDEGDEEYLTPPRRRGHRMSDISMRSSNSSPLKRSPYYSPGSAGKQKVKKEYPLVLLHCTLLPPSLPIPGLVGPPDPKVLKEVLPSEYWRRWKLLEEKVGSGVLRDRGVLISHPEDMYDLLEDRLLESLELQHPRLDHGHFVGHEEGDSEKEDQATKEESETDGEQGEDCPDCGERFLPNNHSRKWEIKVFAANGLMRAGAWAAAWKEMEKVDVEVGLWLPSELRRELEKRLLDSEMSTALTRMEVPQLIEPVAELESQPSLPQPSPSLSAVMPVFFTPERASSPIPPPSPTPAPRQHRPTQNPNPVYPPKEPVEIDLHTLLLNYIRVLASDRRNVAIVLLSVLVVFFAIDYRPREAASNLRPFPHEVLSSSSIPSMHVTSAHGSAEQVPTNIGIQAPINSVSSAPSSAPRQLFADSVSATSLSVAQVEIMQTKKTTDTSSAAIEPSKPQLPSSQDVEIPRQGSEKAEILDNEFAPAPGVAPAEKQLDFQLEELVDPTSESDEQIPPHVVADDADKLSSENKNSVDILTQKQEGSSTDPQQAGLGIQKHELAGAPDPPVPSNLDVVEMTFNDTPKEPSNKVPKTHEEPHDEIHENEQPLIQTQTAAKEKQALISMT